MVVVLGVGLAVQVVPLKVYPVGQLPLPEVALDGENPVVEPAVPKQTPSDGVYPVGQGLAVSVAPLELVHNPVVEFIV